MQRSYFQSDFCIWWVLLRLFMRLCYSNATIVREHKCSLCCNMKLSGSEVEIRGSLERRQGEHIRIDNPVPDGNNLI
jgi:hypothetical protein